MWQSARAVVVVGADAKRVSEAALVGGSKVLGTIRKAEARRRLAPWSLPLPRHVGARPVARDGQSAQNLRTRSSGTKTDL
jgi:hypothetical protein